MRALGVRALALGRLRECDGPLRHFELVDPRAPRQLLDRFAISVPSRTVHVGIRTRRIAPQDSLDATDTFDEGRPVERGEHAHRVDDVGDRELLDGLALLLEPEHLIGRLPARIQSGLQPAPCCRRCDRLIAEVVQDLNDERRRRLGGELKRRIRLVGRAEQLGRKRSRGLAAPASRGASAPRGRTGSPQGRTAA